MEPTFAPSHTEGGARRNDRVCATPARWNRLPLEIINRWPTGRRSRQLHVLAVAGKKGIGWGQRHFPPLPTLSPPLTIRPKLLLEPPVKLEVTRTSAEEARCGYATKSS